LSRGARSKARSEPRRHPSQLNYWQSITPLRTQLRVAIAQVLTRRGFAVTDAGAAPGLDRIMDLEGPGPRTILIVDYDLGFVAWAGRSSYGRRLRGRTCRVVEKDRATLRLIDDSKISRGIADSGSLDVPKRTPPPSPCDSILCMRAIGICLALTLLAAIAVAQPPAPPAMKTFTSSAEITALIAKAKSERKGDAPLVAERILSLAPYNANLEYRGAVGPAAVHVKEAEMFYVIDGSATLVTGGKLVNETRPNPDNLNGTAIENGTPQNVAKGDFVIVPENTPHWFSAINGTLVLMSLHVPRTGAH
jgi:mannose-6-phosphate isomerase-like protein (cupin superfamily)